MTDVRVRVCVRTASPLRGVGRSGTQSQRPRPGRSGTQWDAVDFARALGGSDDGAVALIERWIQLVLDDIEETRA